jgi:hypothetical protein
MLCADVGEGEVGDADAFDRAPIELRLAFIVRPSALIAPRRSAAGSSEKRNRCRATLSLFGGTNRSVFEPYVPPYSDTPLERLCSNGPARTRTWDQRIMSPLL